MNKKIDFEELFFDDDVFGQAMQAADKMIRSYPDRIDLRFYKIAALTGYEKENPDMALSELRSLVDYNASVKPAWACFLSIFTASIAEPPVASIGSTK